MVIVAALVLLAPGVWGDLLTKPVSAWEARLGGGKAEGSSTGEGGFTLRSRSYRKGTIRVNFLGGKPSSVEVTLAEKPKLTWLQALGASGLSGKGASVIGNGTTNISEVISEQTRLRLPSLPKGTEVTFVHRRVGTQTTEQVVGVSVPSSVRLTPEPGVRKAILDRARSEILKATKQTVIFRVSNLRVGDGWAFLAAEPRTPQDKTADWSKLAPAGFEADAYDPVAFALLRQKGKKWQVRALVLGPTDVAWEGWAAEFKAPAGLFRD